MATALDVNDVSTHIQLSRSTVQAVGNVSLTIDHGRDARARRRVRLRQVDPRPLDPGPAAERRSHRRRLDQARGQRARRSAGERPAQDPRQRHRDDLPGLPVLAEPDQVDRRAGRRAGPPAPRRQQEGGARPGARGPRARRPAAAEGAARRLPAPALRRPAPARDDRDRARLRAEGAARRRADDRA